MDRLWEMFQFTPTNPSENQIPKNEQKVRIFHPFRETRLFSVDKDFPMMLNANLLEGLHLNRHKGDFGVTDMDIFGRIKIFGSATEMAVHFLFKIIASPF